MNKNLRFKPLTQPETGCDWYDLFEGGYIKPERMLHPEDAARVREAMELVKSFMSQAYAKGWIEER